MDGQNILVVEDEERVQEMVASYLRREGFQVATASDGLAGLEAARRQRPDLVVLDLMLPRMDGLEVCRELRRESTVPIIMLTARAEEVDRLIGLELGADDYIAKPFSLRELVARIKAVLRRYGQGAAPAEDVLRLGDLQLNFQKHETLLAGRELELTPTEFNLLGMLARSPGRTYSRTQLLEAVMGDAYAGYERSIDTHISNLRRKLEADPANPAYILTVFGVGYRFRPRGTS